jgi:hypothetical protein
MHNKYVAKVGDIEYNIRRTLSRYFQVDNYVDS